MVTVQGLTAAGAGAVSVLEFQSFFSGKGCSAMDLAAVAFLGSSTEPGAASRAVCTLTPSPSRERQGAWAA